MEQAGMLRHSHGPPPPCSRPAVVRSSWMGSESVDVAVRLSASSLSSATPSRISDWHHRSKSIFSCAGTLAEA
eukprot:5208625-Pyramimonas_sp.AAC.1